ncbi:hypothetical protein [Streptomyces sp. enrichment culture]|uniref:hypothetical protein n=1 Tax=Streptomyces sp. enrichment culture TaxID=1795815 RepID=UPI003F56677D
MPDRFSWSWSQDSGPGAAVLGDITSRRVADLGAGAARHAAHLAVHHRPAHPAVQHATPATARSSTRARAPGQPCLMWCIALTSSLTWPVLPLLDHLT